MSKLIKPHFDLETVASSIVNYKSKIIEWSQKENKELRFEIIEDAADPLKKQFVAQIFIDGTGMEKGYGFSKKKAEQDAARKTLEQLNLSSQ